MQVFQFHLPDETFTDALGTALSKVLVPGLVMYLHGDLGAGKTAFTRALLHGAGHTGRVKSPTYTLAEPYEVTIDQQPVTMTHFDLYRMSSPEEFLDAGFREHFNEQSICIIEWPEKGEPVLPNPDIDMTFTVSQSGRDVELRALSDKGNQCLARLNFVPRL